MQKTIIVCALLLSLLPLVHAEKPNEDKAKRQYIEIEAAPKGSPVGTKASWDKGKPTPPESTKRKIRKALGFEN
jgi:hypothetical protein